jgi:putative polyhydroxyalkanoate system protein
MADIEIHRPHDKSPEEARKIVEQVERQLKTKFDLETQWEGNTMRFKRTGLSGEMQIGASEVAVIASLGLMLKPMKGMITTEINKFFDAKLG